MVIGILIALQINNWNEQKKAKAVTKVYVNNLIDDLAKDTLMYSVQIKAAQTKFQYSKEIKEYINGTKIIADTSAFIVNLQSIARLLLPSVNSNTYKDLISTGNIKLIHDKKIIDAIRDYYSDQQDWWYMDYKNQLVNGYLPLAVDVIPMHLHEEILKNEIASTFQDFSDKALLNNKVENYTKEDVRQIMSALKDNTAFNFQLKRITRSHLVQVKILGLSKNSAKSLLNILEKWKNSNSKK